MKQKVIFVDDEVNVLKALKRDMALADIDAEYFISAEDALVHLRQHQVGIVVSDFNMPGMDGVMFLKEVQISYPDMYRVILSSSGMENSKLREALENRTVEQCFDKPWNVNELVAYFERFQSYA